MQWHRVQLQCSCLVQRKIHWQMYFSINVTTHFCMCKIRETLWLPPIVSCRFLTYFQLVIPVLWAAERAAADRRHSCLYCAVVLMLLKWWSWGTESVYFSQLLIAGSMQQKQALCKTTSQASWYLLALMAEGEVCKGGSDGSMKDLGRWKDKW